MPRKAAVPPFEILDYSKSLNKLEYCVYALFESMQFAKRRPKPYYVGLTRHPWKRANDHRYQSWRSGVMVIVGWCDHKSDAHDLEKYVALKYQFEGAVLDNRTLTVRKDASGNLYAPRVYDLEKYLKEQGEKWTEVAFSGAS